MMIPMASLSLGAWGLTLFALERLFPARVAPDDHRRIARNLALGLMVLIASPLIQKATLAVTGEIAPLVVLDNLLLQLLILDLWTYALHRAYHRVPLMWRLHAPHHFDAHLDVTSAVRFHLGEIIWSSILRLIPLLALGIPIETNLVFGTILTASAMFHHSNLRLPPGIERALSWVIVTPSIHWVHHHAVQRDTDANYASILSLWDHLFRSASPTRRTHEMVIGVEGIGEKPVGALLAFPFLR
jgi:sterol desaturase/sphingolipid hydroxylase (fatty acid hydroxylase superfamily)